ncbi:hypothetical protein JCM3765_006706 [Sporobolomyces pararoseus]
MDLNDVNHVRTVARATSQYLIVWTALFVWDTLSTFRLEYRLLWKRDWTLLKACFMLNRYGVLLLELASAVLILTPISQATCRMIYWIQPLTIVFTIIICQSIMAIRIYAIYEREKRIGYLLVCIVAIEAIGVIAAATRIAPLDLVPIIAKTLELEGCLVVARTDHSGKIVFILAIFPFTFDTVILLLAAYRSIVVYRQFKIAIPLLKIVVRDGLLYYLAITATHIVTVYLWYQNDLTTKSFNVPCSIVLPSLMCSRLILSLLSRSESTPTVRPLALTTIGDEDGPKLSRIPIPPSTPNRPQMEEPTVPVFKRSPSPASLPPHPPSPVLLSSPSLPIPRPPKSPLRPGLSNRPSLISRKSEATIDSVRSRRSQLSTSEPPILAIQVTQEVVVSVVSEDSAPVGRRSLSSSRSRENLFSAPDSSGIQKRLTLP